MNENNSQSLIPYSFSKSFYSHEDGEALAQQIFHDMILMVNGSYAYRICEIELYYQDQAYHNDPYVHAHVDQLSFGSFYFHRFRNGSYKSGTYKGMDIALGNAERRIYFGILIRTLENLHSGEFIEGPCRCVNAILEHFGVSDVKSLMTTYFQGQQIAISNPLLYLARAEPSLREEKIYRGPRIGLSSKYPDYQRRPYRFAILIHKIKKERKTLTYC